MNELFVNLPLSDFIEWCQKFRTFLNCDEIDRNHPTHKDWLDHVVGPISFYCKGSQGDSSNAFLEKPPNQHRLSKLGMCCLNNKSPFDVLHPSTEVFAFCVLKGKFRLTPKLVAGRGTNPFLGKTSLLPGKRLIILPLNLERQSRKSAMFVLVSKAPAVIGAGTMHRLWITGKLAMLLYHKIRSGHLPLGWMASLM
jgi:hypothetical protein